MEDDFSPDAAAAFDKLAALKRRYQTEADPVADPAPAPEDEAVDTEDIPVLTEAVIIADPAGEGDDPVDPPVALADWESALVERVIERLRPQLMELLEEAVIKVLQDRAPIVYDTWLAGLRQRTRGAVLEAATQDDADEQTRIDPWDAAMTAVARPQSTSAATDGPEDLDGAAPS